MNGTEILVCVLCPNGCELEVKNEGSELVVTGNRCKKGIKFAEQELVSPKRTLTTTVKTVFSDFPVLPVKTDGEIDKSELIRVNRALKEVEVGVRLAPGDIICNNILGLGVNIIASANMKRIMEE